jgi:protein gp37
MQKYLADEECQARILGAGNDPDWGIRWEEPEEMLHSVAWPLPNVWLGVTAETQRWADERIPPLLGTPGKHWVSLEPLLGPINLRRIGQPAYLRRNALSGMLESSSGAAVMRDSRPALDWVVIGGESGPKHRPMELEWAEDILSQCCDAGVPAYFKQAAANKPGQPSGIPLLDTIKQLPAALGKPGSEEE